MSACEDEDGNGSCSSSSSATSPAALRLPLTKVRSLMKLDPDLQLVAQDAVFLVAKAAEMLIEMLIKETAKVMSQRKKKKTILTLPDLEEFLQNDSYEDCLKFLMGGLVLKLDNMTIVNGTLDGVSILDIKDDG